MNKDIIEYTLGIWEVDPFDPEEHKKAKTLIMEMHDSYESAEQSAFMHRLRLEVDPDDVKIRIWKTIKPNREQYTALINKLKQETVNEQTQ